MITIKSTIPVIVNYKTLETAIVYLKVKSVRFTGTHYMADILYSFTKTEVIDGVTYTHEMPLFAVTPAFAKEQVDVLETMIPNLPTTMNDRFLSLISAACMYQLANDPVPVFGLTGAQWELVI